MEKYKKYLNNNYKFGKVTFAAILCAIFVISNFYGFVYEVIFYYFNGGMKDIYWRGGCFGPWIIIYGIGALLIYFTAYKRRKKPLEVFLISGFGCGVLEFLTGAGFYYLMDGTRHWDYNTEILNFGNIGGFVCLRSVLVFAVSGMLLIYVIVPLLYYLAKKMNRKVFLAVCFTLFAIYAADQLYSSLITAVFPNLPDAYDIYGNLGFKFMEF